MDLSTLGITPEQMTELEGHISESNTTFGQSSEDRVRTEYSKKLKVATDELEVYKPTVKTESEKAMDIRLQALETRENELKGKEQLSTLTAKLSESGLPSQLSKYLVGVEDIDTEITSLKEMFNSLKIDGSFKPVNHTGGADAITNEKFAKMSYKEKAALYTTNQDLFERLSK